MSVITKEQADFNLQLESIIAPHFNARRMWKRDKDNPPGTPFDQLRVNFAHYTSAEAALNIIRTKRLWMRSTTCMIDYTEVNRGHQLLVEHLGANEGKRRMELIAALNKVHPGAAERAIGRFDALWKDRFMRFRMYIASLCEHEDKRHLPNGRLSMWRAFGRGPRVALILSLPTFSPASQVLGLTAFSPVCYSKAEEVASQLDATITMINRNVDILKKLTVEAFEALILVMFLTNVTCNKHEGFSEEEEWRAVYAPDLLSSKLIESEVRAIDGVAQTIFKIPLDAKVSPELEALDLSNILKRVLIGPSQYSWVQFEAFKTELAKIGSNAEVTVSPLPIRG